MVKADKWIEIFIAGDQDNECINPASLDLRLGNHILERFADDTMYVGTRERNNLADGEQILLKPGSQWLLCTEPVYVRESQAGLFTLKSSIGRRGLFLAHPGWIDPGYEGAITFSVMVHFPVIVTIGERIGQIIYFQMEEVPRKLYGDDTGRYQHSTGVVQEKVNAQEDKKE